MASDGSFVIVGEISGQDGSGTGIFGQRYGSDGTPVGAEFQVNTTTANNQTLPSVAIRNDGSFIVAWGSQQDSPDNSIGVFGQRYDSNGDPLGSEFQIHTYTTGNQQEPSVSMANDGTFVVAWYDSEQDGSNEGIYGQLYDSNGVAVGSEFQVNTYTDNRQWNPSVAMKDDGSFTIVWGSFGQDGSSYGVFGREYDSNGTPTSNEFLVTTETNEEQQEPAIAATGTGDAIVVWQSRYQDGDNWGIFGRQLQF